MLQRPKSLPHVMTFAQHRFESISIDEVGGGLFPLSPSTASEGHDQQSGDGAENDESRNDDVHAHAVQGAAPGRRDPARCLTGGKLFATVPGRPVFAMVRRGYDLAGSAGHCRPLSASAPPPERAR